MAYAAITFVYNESVNLKIWAKYYGEMFGHENLYVVDRGSDDGSTDDLGSVNLIKVPRRKFDEHEKTHLMASLHSSLTSVYDAVIVTDCDEILVPDPDRYESLSAYLDGMPGDYANAMGIDVIHMMTIEPPIDLSRPILSQRRFGRFFSPECKHLASRVPIRWLPGLHASDKPPIFDTNLYLFHLKYMDYSCAVKRQAINNNTEWSQDSLDKNYGLHHRWNLEHFVHQGFLVPIDLRNRGLIEEFAFEKQVALLEEKVVRDPEGNYRLPMDISNMINIPDRFRDSF
jgi:hypothetical protein